MTLCTPSLSPTGGSFTFVSVGEKLEIILWRYDELEDPKKVLKPEMVVTGPVQAEPHFFISVSVSSDRRYISALGSDNFVYTWQRDLRIFMGRFLINSSTYGYCSKIGFLPTEKAPGIATSSKTVDYTILSATDSFCVEAWYIPREPSTLGPGLEADGVVDREPVFALQGHNVCYTSGRYDFRLRILRKVLVLTMAVILLQFQIRDFSVFPDSQYLLTASLDRTMAIWNLSTKEAETVIKPDEYGPGKPPAPALQFDLQSMRMQYILFLRVVEVYYTTSA